jgi:hypothetical protein
MFNPKSFFVYISRKKIYKTLVILRWSEPAVYNCCFICIVAEVVNANDRTVSSSIELAFDDDESVRLTNGETTSLPIVFGDVDLEKYFLFI